MLSIRRAAAQNAPWAIVCKRHHYSARPPGMPMEFRALSRRRLEDRRRFSDVGTRSFYSKKKTEASILTDRYHELVEKEGYTPDEHQLRALQKLERLRVELRQYEPKSNLSKTNDASSESGTSNASSWLGKLFGGGASSSQTSSSSKWNKIKASLVPQSVPQGVYLHGGVGCGKTFLMRLFYESLDYDLPQWKEQCQWQHFHKFMLQSVHESMHKARGQTHADALVPSVVGNILQNGRLLCLDEFQVTDVADAMILQRLFQGLWQHGCIVVATSNRAPQDLYLNGLQRDRFLPFIDLLQQQNEICNMSDSETDYRLIQRLTSGEGQVYYIGNSRSEAYQKFDQLFYDLVEQSPVAPTSLQTQGRTVKIPQAAYSKGICRFDFADLCKKALGAADYLILGQHFHTVFVEHVPVMTLNELNWLRRFITFVDSMYECQVKVIIQSKARPEELLKLADDECASQHDEVFAFDRTVSRLNEMGSLKYLQQQHCGRAARSKAELLSTKKVTVGYTPS